LLFLILFPWLFQSGFISFFWTFREEELMCGAACPANLEKLPAAKPIKETRGTGLFVE